jgi:hypothetical protein
MSGRKGKRKGIQILQRLRDYREKGTTIPEASSNFSSLFASECNTPIVPHALPIFCFMNLCIHKISQSTNKTNTISCNIPVLQSKMQTQNTTHTPIHHTYSHINHTIILCLQLAQSCVFFLVLFLHVLSSGTTRKKEESAE